MHHAAGLWIVSNGHNGHVMSIRHVQWTSIVNVSNCTPTKTENCEWTLVDVHCVYNWSLYMSILHCAHFTVHWTFPTDARSPLCSLDTIHKLPCTFALELCVWSYNMTSILLILYPLNICPFLPPGTLKKSLWNTMCTSGSASTPRRTSMEQRPTRQWNWTPTTTTNPSSTERYRHNE